jgi:hypothetical protein
MVILCHHGNLGDRIVIGRVVIAGLVLVTYQASAWQPSSEQIYEYCKASASSATAFLQDRYSGMTLEEVMDTELERLKSLGVESLFGSSQQEILAAFDRPFPSDPSLQSDEILNLKNDYLRKCIKENSR